MTVGVKGTGIMSLVWTPEHTIKGYSRYWRTKEDLKAYADRENLRKRMKSTGIYNPEELKRVERETNAPLKLSRAVDKNIKIKMQIIRERYDLPKNTNRLKLQKLAKITRDPDILSLLGMQGTARMSDSQRIREIRRIYAQALSSSEILFKVANVVGIELKSRSNTIQ